MARPRVHLVATALVGLACRRWLGPGGWPGLLAAGVLVDADHLVDLALARRAGRRRRSVLPLHGWEYCALLALVGRARPAARAAALGLLLHLLIDQFTNRPEHPALYSVIFRTRHRYAADRLGFRAGDGSWVHQRPWHWL